MTEAQANEIIKLLNSIDSTLSNIESDMPSTTYDLGDVCSRLDNVEKAIGNIR